MRVVIVGQAPSRTSDPRRPLSGLSGRRLEVTAGLEQGTLAARASLVNLLVRWPGYAEGAHGDRFDREAARRSVSRLARRLDGRDVILLGRHVSRAFGLELRPLRWSVFVGPACTFRVAMLPHPSGVNLWWNEERHRRAAARFLRAALAGHSPARVGGSAPSRRKGGL